MTRGISFAGQEAGARAVNGEKTPLISQRLVMKEMPLMKNTRPALRPIPLLASALLGLALAGCAHKDTIVGKWQGTITQPNGTMNSTYEFTPDGKETINGQASSAGMTMNIGVSGTYTVNGANLTQTLTTMTLGTRTVPMPAHPSNPAPFTLDGDHLTLTDPSGKQTMTLTRVKQ